MADGPVVFYDGECALCHQSVRLLARFDHRRLFLFAPLNGDTARARLGPSPPTVTPGSLVLLDADGVWTRSTAVLRIVRRLDWPLRGAAVAGLCPRPVRDALYDWVARNRYRWFGRADRCGLPTPDVRARLLP